MSSLRQIVVEEVEEIVVVRLVESRYIGISHDL
jgi:hypothetical protein